MMFNLVLASLAFAATSVVAEACGSTSRAILDQTSFIYRDQEITITTSSCPAFNTNSTGSSLESGKRQFPELCSSDTTCDFITCTPNQTTLAGDCFNLASALQEMVGLSSQVEASDVLEISLGSCTFTFLNESDGPFVVCWSTLGIVGL
ncbi:hypothetical protein BT96DRAFT_606962 [Gymnopus androsaceus JB14]|uniref:Uncharacterized protein n=1 Tax=Gymnopus androsaceus JB14 TaxID=1447944 RepID=A0A6A4HQQ9_9AGAR|nr:hypothetical protein BT96DRAFT_606962 [Gymnopus androsaceus JB14]